MINIDNCAWHTPHTHTLACLIHSNWNATDQLIKGSHSSESQADYKRLEISSSLPSVSTDVPRTACLHLYADTRLIFYPVTRFLSSRFRQQSDVCLLLVTTKTWFIHNNISPGLCRLLFAFTVADLPRWMQAAFSPFVSQMCTYSHTHTSPTYCSVKWNCRGLSISSTAPCVIIRLMSPGK